MASDVCPVQAAVFEWEKFDGVGVLVIAGYVPILIKSGKHAEAAEWGGVLDDTEGEKVTALFNANVRQALGVSSLTFV